VRTTLRRSLISRLEIIVALVIVIAGSLPALTTWAQDSGATSFTIASSNGNVVIKRADGSAEMARPGTTLGPNDLLASVGRSEATVNLGSQTGGSGATLLLFSDTTIGVRGNNSGGGGFYVADLAQGVVLARTLPGSNATVQITNETAGAVAQLKQGGMSVANDIGTGTIAVACDDKTSQVAFPYTDMRVPCENNVVRTLSNNRTIDDSAADSNSPVTSAVQAAGNNVAAQQQQSNQAQSQHTASQKEDKDNAPVVVASPAPSNGGSPPTGGGQPCNSSTNSGGEGVTSTVHQLGRSSGTFIFQYDAFSIPDQFDILYEGRTIFTTGSAVSGSNGTGTAVSYSGSSTQVTVRVTGVVGSGTSWTYTVFCPS
jgi:hypothetical protein